MDEEEQDDSDDTASVASTETFTSSVGRRRPLDRLSLAETDASLHLSPLPRQARAARQRILFTGVAPSPQDLRNIVKLGGSVAESARGASVVVCDGARRTCKLLACVALGTPVVGPAWLATAYQAKCFPDPWDHLLKDPAAERKFGFSLKSALQKAAKSKVFAGVSVHATAGVRPPPDDMRELVECGGGDYLEAPPSPLYPGVVVVTCPEDCPPKHPLRKRGNPLVSAEFVLSGILKGKADVNEYAL